MNMEYKFIADAQNVGERLDKFLANKLDMVSRSFIQNLIIANHALVNEKKTKPGYFLKIGDNILITIPELQDNAELKLKPENMALDILYEDDNIIVINKPAGIIVHPAQGVVSGTVVNFLLYHCKTLSDLNGPMRPGIVHRLDKDTSGVLIAAKNNSAHANLAEQFKNRKVKKTYMAVVRGVIPQDEGEIDRPIGRCVSHRTKMAIAYIGGKRALTKFKVIERYHQNTLINAYPTTGRTHQIRVHMAYLGYPIVGDKIYGESKGLVSKLDSLIDRQALHAYRISFSHPASNKDVEFIAPLADDIKKLIDMERELGYERIKI
ncbi:MAG: RluA family pseudouridine synthase [bacterium]|nr:RluA family pseudouridine synthase [bacterium]